MTHNIPGLAIPWQWIQPRTDSELIARLIQARDYMVHERERENLCSVAAGRLTALVVRLEYTPSPESFAALSNERDQLAAALAKKRA